MQRYIKLKETPHCRWKHLQREWQWDPMTAPFWNWADVDYNYPAEPEPPKLVPWTFETCPKVAVIYTTKDGRKNYRVPFAFSEAGLEFVNGCDMADWKYLLEECIYSLDGGKTWLPCGTEEKR